MMHEDRGKQAGWGTAADVKDILGNLSENQNLNNEKAIFRVRRAPRGHPAQMPHLKLKTRRPRRSPRFSREARPSSEAAELERQRGQG